MAFCLKRGRMWWKSAVDCFYSFDFTPNYRAFSNYVSALIRLKCEHRPWTRILAKTFKFYLFIVIGTAQTFLIWLLARNGGQSAYFQYDLLAEFFRQNELTKPEVYGFALIMMTCVTWFHFHVYFLIPLSVWRIADQLLDQNLHHFVAANRKFCQRTQFPDRWSSWPIRDLWSGRDRHTDKPFCFKRKIPGFVAVPNMVLSRMVLVYRVFNCFYATFILIYCKLIGSIEDAKLKFVFSRTDLAFSFLALNLTANYLALPNSWPVVLVSSFEAFWIISRVVHNYEMVLMSGLTGIGDCWIRKTV